MTILPFTMAAGEALALGFATGPVCVATCGPVVVPWMLAQSEGVRRHGLQLGLFMTARLTGYLLFGAAVWLAGAAIPRAWTGRSWLLGAVQVLLAVSLAAYPTGWPRRRPKCAQRPEPLVQIGEPMRGKARSALALGFLTGINICPPFLVAGVRAVQLDSLSASLLFFALFFVGTAVWFLPLLSLGLLRRTPAVVTVARAAALLLACWYGFSGVLVLIERVIYG
jgi:sulfite exporter TauE/SafE